MSFVFFLLEILAIKEAMKFNVWISHGYCPLLISDKFGPYAENRDADAAHGQRFQVEMQRLIAAGAYNNLL
jgi:hypothetical protein